MGFVMTTPRKAQALAPFFAATFISDCAHLFSIQHLVASKPAQTQLLDSPIAVQNSRCLPPLLCTGTLGMSSCNRSSNFQCNIHPLFIDTFAVLKNGDEVR
jgi:hypothetical protein